MEKRSSKIGSAKAKIQATKEDVAKKRQKKCCYKVVIKKNQGREGLRTPTRLGK